MNAPSLTMAGIVGGALRTVVIDDHLPITSFRLGSTTRRYDRSVGGWVDGETTWVTVTCFRGLARNVAKSIAKRDRVVVHGRLRVRLWRRDDGEHRTSVEVEADFANARGYGDLKVGVAEAVIETLRPIQARYAGLMADAAELDRILAHGAEQARAVSQPKVDEMKRIMGLVVPG